MIKAKLVCDSAYICLFAFRFYLMKMCIIFLKRYEFLFMETHITLLIHFVKMCEK